MPDTPEDTLPLLDLMVESRMSRERAQRQLVAGLVTVDGQPVKDPATPVTRIALELGASLADVAATIDTRPCTS